MKNEEARKENNSKQKHATSANDRKMFIKSNQNAKQDEQKEHDEQLPNIVSHPPPLNTAGLF